MNKIHEVPLEWALSADIKDKTTAECALVEVLVKVGDKVKHHDELAIIEAAKGTEAIESPVSGEIKAIFLEAREAPYLYGMILCTIEEK